MEKKIWKKKKFGKKNFGKKKFGKNNFGKLKNIVYIYIYIFAKPTTIGMLVPRATVIIFIQMAIQSLICQSFMLFHRADLEI